MATLSTPLPSTLPALLGSARYGTYIAAAHGDADRAAELYAWGAALAGAWHAHLGYVEVATRNAIDRELREWNASHANLPAQWTAPKAAAVPLFKALGRTLSDARASAAKDASRRSSSHPRAGQAPNHDDIVAQLTLGAWCHLVMPPDEAAGKATAAIIASRQELWSQALHRAFPGVSPSIDDRRRVGRQLEAMRRLRNRVAHHENLLSLPIGPRLNGSLWLLSTINPDFPMFVMRHNTIRQLEAADPRKRW